MPNPIQKRAISSDGAPKAIGPYSQAIEVSSGRMVFCSGQIPLDPKTGALVEGSIAVQTERVMENLRAVLAAASMDFSNVVRTGIFLVDLNDFAAVNDVYAKHFPGTPPARSTVQVAGLPKNARVEVEAIAIG